MSQTSDSQVAPADITAAVATDSSVADDYSTDDYSVMSISTDSDSESDSEGPPVASAPVAAAPVAAVPATYFDGANIGNTAVALAGPPPAFSVVIPAPTSIRMSGPWVAGQIYGVIPHGPLSLVPDNGEKWYAITKGRYIGCTPSTAIADNAVTCVSHALRSSYGSQALAVAAFNAALASPFLGLIQVIQVL
ncbi:hypothetical protein C8R43DRAFT_964000 [Mycena crocata]|nr:hypothetical protein C8R43DRAFT_964000 [Mycena crocata]